MHAMVRMSLLNYYFLHVYLLQMSIPKEKGKSPSSRELIGPLLDGTGLSQKDVSPPFGLFHLKSQGSNCASGASTCLEIAYQP